jgi:hypothetical protein
LPQQGMLLGPYLADNRRCRIIMSRQTSSEIPPFVSFEIPPSR